MYEEAPLLIISNVDEQLKIQLYDLKVLKGSIEPTELGRDRIEMEGKWRQTSALKHFNLFFPYLAPASTDSLFEFDRNDSLAELHVFDNQVTISQHNLKFAYDFWLVFRVNISILICLTLWRDLAIGTLIRPPIINWKSMTAIHHGNLSEARRFISSK